MLAHVLISLINKVKIRKNKANHFGQFLPLHSLLNCDVAMHDEKMMLANLEFLTKFLMSHASIKNISMCFEALGQKGR